MRCKAEGCSEEAKWHAILALRESAKRAEDAPMGKAPTGLYLCDEHRNKTTKVSDLLNTDIWTKIADGIEKSGQPRPDYETSTFEFADMALAEAAAPRELLHAVQKVVQSVDVFAGGGTRPYLVQAASSLATVARASARVFQRYPGDGGKAARLVLTERLLAMAEAADAVAIEFQRQQPRDGSDTAAAESSERAVTKLRATMREASTAFLPALRGSGGAN